MGPTACTMESNDILEIIQEAIVLNPSTGKVCKSLEGVGPGKDFFKDIFQLNEEYTLVLIMPQLGDFDSAEYAEMIAAVQDDLREARIGVRIIGIGDIDSAKRFANFSKLDLSLIRVDPNGDLHRNLGLHAGPNWDIPSFVPNSVLEWFADYVGATNKEVRDVKTVARAWLNYMAMCAGISSPDTLPEIFRGYFGDKNAPERIRSDEVVTVGGTPDEPLISIKGTTDVKLGPFKYQQLWKDDKGYQRPVELATVRLRVMVEVLSNFQSYVPDQRHLDLRGATFLFKNDDERLIYKHIDTGVLSYSPTMSRPISFLEPFIGRKALNPLELGDSR